MYWPYWRQVILNFDFLKIRNICFFAYTKSKLQTFLNLNYKYSEMFSENISFRAFVTKNLIVFPAQFDAVADREALQHDRGSQIN